MQRRRNVFLSGSSFPHVAPQTTRISRCNLQSESCCNYTPGSSSFPLVKHANQGKKVEGKYDFQCWWKFSCKFWKVGGGWGDDVRNVVVDWESRPAEHTVPQIKRPSFTLKPISENAEVSSDVMTSSRSAHTGMCICPQQWIRYTHTDTRIQSGKKRGANNWKHPQCLILARILSKASSRCFVFGGLESY